MSVKFYNVYTDCKKMMVIWMELKKKQIEISDNKYVLLHIYLVRRLHDINTFI